MGCGSSSSGHQPSQSYPRNNNYYGNQNNQPNNYSNGPVQNYQNQNNQPQSQLAEQRREKPVVQQQRKQKAAGVGPGNSSGRPINGYHPNELGIYEKYHDFREYPSENEHNDRPYGDPSMLYVDEDFPLHVAIREADSSGLEWKRPGEFCVNPVLITDGTTRFDIRQGCAGTCWFLSMIALLSEKEELFKRILPVEDAYLIETDNYDGVFHCRFWKFGEWIDVYIDDFLPVVNGSKPWGAHSSTDDNEMWVSLMEKSFARFHDGYNEVYGGQPGNAFLALSGGVSEFIDFKKMKMKPRRLHDRIKNSLASGAIVSCSVPAELDGQCGLVGGHAYSLTGAYVVRDVENRIIPLLRVRNPWGHTEWTGAWSDGSSEWNDLNPGQIDHVHEDDGEFFMSLKDFLEYFSCVTICSVLPDFDRDGCSDSLNFVTAVYGQWYGDTATGFDDRLLNPRYKFTIPPDGADEEGKVPVVVQIIQHMERRKDESEKVVLRCDIYKVLAESEGGDLLSIELQGDRTNVYSPEIQVTYRHLLDPGDYIIIPSTLDAGVEKEYLIRVFTSCPLRAVDDVPQSVSLMSCATTDEVIVADERFDLNCSKTVMGAFICNFNAGGQVACQDSFDSNPQFAFSIAEPTAVVFTLMQENVEPKFPIGLQVFPLTSEPPVDIDYLYEMYDSAIPTTEGQQGKFVNGWEINCEYYLMPGDYVALTHMNDPTDEKRYCVSVKSSSPIEIIFQKDNTFVWEVVKTIGMEDTRQVVSIMTESLLN